MKPSPSQTPEYRAAYRAAHKEEAKALAAAWRANNPERVKQNRRDYLLKKGDEIRAKMHIWNKENRDKVKVNKSAYYLANKNLIKAKQAEYRDKTKEKRKARERAFDKANPGRKRALRLARYATPEGKAKAIAVVAIRRARKRAALIGDVKQIESWERKWRAMPRVTCYWCGGVVKGKAAHSDHIHPISAGGAHCLGNLCISCAPCNHRKNAKPVSEWNKYISSPVLL